MQNQMSVKQSEDTAANQYSSFDSSSDTNHSDDIIDFFCIEESSEEKKQNCSGKLSAQIEDIKEEFSSIYGDHLNSAPQQKVQDTKLTKQEQTDKQKQTRAILCLMSDSIMVNFQKFKELINKRDPSLIVVEEEFQELCIQVCHNIIRALERFMYIECQYKAKPFETEAINLFSPLFLDCQELMDLKMRRAFLQFIKHTFEIQQVDLQAQKVIYIYKRLEEVNRNHKKLAQSKLQPQLYPSLVILKQEDATNMQKSRKSPSITTTQKLNQIWSQDHIIFLKHQMRRTHYRSELLFLFKKRFPEYRHLWTKNFMQTKINQVIRQGFKVLQTVANMRSHNLPALASINRDMVEIFSTRTFYCDIRMMLINFMEDETNIGNVKDLILEVNKAAAEIKEKNRKAMKDVELRLEEKGFIH